jgi:hypothetical protein
MEFLIALKLRRENNFGILRKCKSSRRALPRAGDGDRGCALYFAIKKLKVNNILMRSK